VVWVGDVGSGLGVGFRRIDAREKSFYFAHVAALDKHLGGVSNCSRVELVGGSKLSKSIGRWAEDDIGSAARPVGRADTLRMLLDVDYGRYGLDLGQRRKLLQGRIGDERLDLIDFRPTVAVLDAAGYELDVRMWLDAVWR
jgi:hypothetical protein